MIIICFTIQLILLTQSWQQSTLQDDTLHIQWIIQILRIFGNSIDNSSVGFLDLCTERFGFSLIQLNEELALACNTYLLTLVKSIYIVIIIIICFILQIILLSQSWRQQGDTLHIQWKIQIPCIQMRSINNSSVGFFDFYFFVSVCGSMCWCLYLQVLKYSLLRGYH